MAKEKTTEELWEAINSHDAENHLIREPGRFQPGRLGDFLFILCAVNNKLLTIGSDHVRTGISNQHQIDRMAEILKEFLEDWLQNDRIEDLYKHLDKIRQPLT